MESKHYTPNMKPRDLNPREDHHDLHDLWFSTRSFVVIVVQTPRFFSIKSKSGPTYGPFSLSRSMKMVVVRESTTLSSGYFGLILFF